MILLAVGGVWLCIGSGFFPTLLHEALFYWGTPHRDQTEERFDECVASGDPPPYEVVVGGGLEIELPFPELPRLDVSLRYVEDGGRPFTAGLRSSLLTADWTLRGWEPGGTRAWIRDSRSLSGSFITQVGRIRPGGVFSRTTLDVDDHMRLRAPGDYRFHVVRRFSSGEISSSELVFRWTPCDIVVTDEERARAEELWLAVDDGPVVFLVRSIEDHVPWEDPEEPWVQLCLMGFSALPTLLEALDDPGESPQRRAWALALLHSLTGVVEPLDVPGSCGPRRRARSEWSQRLIVIDDDGPLASPQRDLISRWHALAPLINVVDGGG